MHEEVVCLWNKPIVSLPTFIDLGRLSKRIDVFVVNDVDNENINKIPTNQRSESRAQDIANVIEIVSSNLESPQTHATLLECLPKFLSDAEGNLDYRVYLEDLFKAFDGDNSPSVKLFKLVNQATVFIPIVYMKTTVLATKTYLKPDELLTKDVRSADGWRVEIEILPSKDVSVSHIRKDQGLGAPICPGYWDVQWRFKVCFAPNMTEIRYSKLDITSMTFDSKVPSKMKAELQRVYYECINNDFSYSLGSNDAIKVDDSTHDSLFTCNRCDCRCTLM